MSQIQLSITKLFRLTQISRGHLGVRVSSLLHEDAKLLLYTRRFANDFL